MGVSSELPPAARSRLLERARDASRVGGEALSGHHIADGQDTARRALLAVVVGHRRGDGHRFLALGQYQRTADDPIGGDAHRESKTIFSEGDLLIRAVAGHHRDAPAVIYRIDHAGKSITFSGDIDADGLAGLRSIVRDTSLLVFNSVVLDPPGSPAILYTLHTPPKTIGEIADDGRVKQLLLSHLSPTIENARAAVEASVAARYKGPMTFARDGLRVVP